MADFDLDPRLAANHYIVDWPLCTVLLEDDARFPWLVLVPRRAGVREIFELSSQDQMQLTSEIVSVAERVAKALKPTKMNVGMLGNMVPQLHAHVIARFDTDPAWPGPVWGVGTRQRYGADEVATVVAAMKAAIAPPT